MVYQKITRTELTRTNNFNQFQQELTNFGYQILDQDKTQIHYEKGLNDPTIIVRLNDEMVQIVATDSYNPELGTQESKKVEGKLQLQINSLIKRFNLIQV